MRTEIVDRTVEQLVENKERQRMIANPEYQRGEVWKPHQQKKLIDSIFRGYQLPIFYLHNISEEFSDGGRMDRLEIIDGQQRVNALHRFVKGDFRLYDVDDCAAQFPTFLNGIIPVRQGSVSAMKMNSYGQAVSLGRTCTIAHRSAWRLRDVAITNINPSPDDLAGFCYRAGLGSRFRLVPVVAGRDWLGGVSNHWPTCDPGRQPLAQRGSANA